MTETNTLVQSLSKAGHTYVHDTKRNLYIFLNTQELYNTLSDIKNQFNNATNTTQEGLNCTNKEALNRIDVLEKIIKFLTNTTNAIKLFDYIPYTKDNKFSKSTPAIVFIPNIKDTWNGEYFSQYELVLQLRPYEYYDSEHMISKEIAFLDITWASLCNRISPKSIIDENCNFIKLEPIKRNSYLKQTELQPGTSYNDAKGSEHLYLGYIDNKPAYIKLTTKIKKTLSNYTTLYDFLHARFTENIKSKYNKGWYDTNPYERFSSNSSRKLLSVNTVYFDENHNNVNTIKIKLPRYYDDNLKYDDNEKNYHSYTLKFRKNI